MEGAGGAVAGMHSSGPLAEEGLEELEPGEDNNKVVVEMSSGQPQASTVFDRWAARGRGMEKNMPPDDCWTGRCGGGPFKPGPSGL